MNNLNLAENIKQEPGKGLGASNASIDQEGRGVDKCRRRHSSKGDGDKGRRGTDRNRSTKGNVDTSRRDISQDSGREPIGVVVAEGRHEESGKSDENYEEGKLMEIVTARHGRVEINPSEIVTINGGVVGFPTVSKYIFLPFMEGTEFELFQSVDNPDLAFITVDPFLFRGDYEFNIDDQDQEELEAETKNDIFIRVFVTIPDDIELMTANLQGPLVINQKSLLGKQLILHGTEYTTKERIFPDKN